jgi:hypothetical protein
MISVTFISFVMFRIMVLSLLQFTYCYCNIYYIFIVSFSVLYL